MDYRTIVMKSGNCDRCDGCGYLDDGERQPFRHWAELPIQSAVALQMGLVKPIECDECNGTGSNPSVKNVAEQSQHEAKP